MYPVFITLSGKRCLVVGGGEVAERKIERLLETGALVTVVSPENTTSISDWADLELVELHSRKYQTGEAAGYFLVIAATGDMELNRRISKDATQAERLVNVVDVPDMCNFFVPSIVRRGAFQIAISTGGASPALAKKIRMDLEETYTDGYKKLVDRLKEFRTLLMKKEPDGEKRKLILNRVVRSPETERFLDGDEEPLELFLKQCV